MNYLQEDHNLYLLHITNSMIASKHQQKIWLDMIEHMKTPVGLYNITTCPIALTKIVKNYKYKK